MARIVNSGMLFLSLALVISFYLLSEAIETLSPNRYSVKVKGYAEINVDSDWAEWNVYIKFTHADPKMAYDGLKNDIDRVIKFIKDKGFDEKSISLGTIDLGAEYELNKDGYPTNKKIATTLNQSIKVSTKQVDLINDLSVKVGELIGEGISISSSVPQFSLNNLESLKHEILEQAAADALVRAEKLAASTNNKIGNLLSAQQGIFQITSQGSNEISDYGMYDMSTMGKSVKAVVTMEFGLK